MASLVLGLAVLTPTNEAGFALSNPVSNGAVLRWIWGEFVLLFSCAAAAAFIRLRIRQRIGALAKQVAQTPFAPPHSFGVGTPLEDRDFSNVLARSARYVQERLAASARSEHQARRIVDSNIIGIAKWRKDGLILDANDAFLRLIGYSRAELQSGALHWAKITPEEHMPLDFQALEQIRTTGASAPFEKEYLHRAGHRVPVLVAGASTDESGEEGVCFALDRSEAKRNHAALTRRIELEHLVASFSARLISLPCDQLSDAMTDVLKEFGIRAGLDGAAIFLFELSHHQSLKRYEWHPSDRTANPGLSRPSSAVLHGLDRLRAGEIVESYSLPEGSKKNQKTSALINEVNIPLLYGGILAGVLTIHSHQKDGGVSSDDLTIFRLLGQVMANALARLRADAALRESEETKRAVWETSLDGIITMDNSGCIRDWNPAAEKIFGYSRDEIVGQPLAEKIIPAVLRKQHNAAIRRFLAMGTSGMAGSRMDIQALRKDGTEFPCELAITPVVLNDNEAMFIGTVRDITERRQSDERLRASQSALQHAVEQTRSVLDALPVRVALFDATGAIIVTNRVWCNEGEPDWMLPIKAQSDAVQSTILGRVLDVAVGRSNNFTLEYATTLRSEKRWFRVMAASLADRARGAVVMHMDITEQQLAVEALGDSEERYRSLVENAREAIFSLAPDGILRSLNPAFTEITGYPREQWIGRKIDTFVHAYDVEKAKSIFARVLGGETPAPFTLRATHAEGRDLEFECTAVPQCVDGTVVGILGVARDVTERNRLEEKLRQAERIDSIGQLAAGVAHDFNNILTIQQSYASELAELSNLPRQARQAVEEITAAGERAALLTRKLLAFGRRQAMQPRVLDCRDFLRGMHQSIEHILGDDIAYTFAAAPTLPPIYIDADMLEQVVTILVSNAHDAMPDGGALVISTEHLDLTEHSAKANPEARAGSFVLITVTDTGCGISAENLQHLFEPFFTTKDVARGAGLGLATVHGIIKQHNGWLEVDSRPQAGTTFRIYLPAIQSRQTPSVPSESVIDSTVQKGTQETILVVEDEVKLCAVVGQFLKRRGYHVLTAASGIEALKLWETHRGQIDLLLTDLVMPEGMTGKELADQLLAERPNLKVLYTSGYSSEVAGRDLSLRAGFNFLPKPYQPAVLAKVVRECLDKE